MLAFWMGGASGYAITPVSTEQYAGGWEYVTDRKRTKRDIEKARKEYGLALDVIETVALRQSEHLLTDKQKIYDELEGELKLKGLQINAKYLEELNNLREAYITEEIAKLMKLKIQREDEELLMLIALAI